jgi:hypothetical protein
MDATNLLIGFVLFNPQLIFWYIGVVCAAFSFLCGLVLNISKLMEDKLSWLMVSKSCNFCKFCGRIYGEWHIFIFPVIPATTVGPNLYKQNTGLVAGLSPPIAGFDPRSVHVGFVVYRLILGQVLCRVVRYSLFTVISQMTHFIRLPLTLHS